MGGDFLAFGDDLVHRLDHGGAADGEAAAAIGPHAEGDFRGVAVNDLHLIEGDAELIDHELREGGFMALAVAVGAGEHGDAAGGMDADFRALIKPRSGTERADDGRGGDAAGFQVGGDADAAQLASCLGGGAAGFEAVPVGVGERDLQRRLVVAAVVLQGDRCLVGEGVGGDEVLAAKFNAIHAGVVGDDIHQAFQKEGRLWPAGATVGVHRDGIGEHGLDVAVDHRGFVDAGKQRCVQVGGHGRGEGGQVGAHVGQGGDAQAQERAVLVDGHFGGADVVAAVRVAHEAFAAVGGPFHRAAEFAGRPGDDGFFGVVVDLAAEAAADIRGDDAQLGFRNVQHEGAHQQADDVRVLAGGVEGEVAGGCVVVAEGDPGLHGVGDQAVVGQIQLHDMRGAGEDVVHDRLVADDPVVAEVAGHAVMNFDGAGFDRVGQVGHGGQIAVVDFQQFGGVFGFLLAGGDDHGDRVADVADLADREDGVRRFGHRGAVLVVDLPAAGQAADAVGLHISADEDLHHAGRGRGGGDVDFVDLGVWPVGPLDDSIKLTGAVDVVGVVALPAEEAQVFLSAYGCANALEAHDRSPCVAGGVAYSAACLSLGACINGCAAAIAFTMLWYPVHRQRLPSRPSRISFSVNPSGWDCTRSTAVMTMPGVQKPHCRA